MTVATLTAMAMATTAAAPLWQQQAGSRGSSNTSSAPTAVVHVLINFVILFCNSTNNNTYNKKFVVRTGLDLVLVTTPGEEP